MSDEIERVENPFLNTTDDRLNIGAISVESERAIAEVKAAIVIAKSSPRNKYAAMEKVLDACSRPDFAKTALFAYPRGGEQIVGASIRLAELLARCWGNIDYGIKELSQDDGESEMLAYAWDLENNTRSVQTFRVKHIRNSRGSYTPLTDQRDIYELAANLGARRLRARILAIIDADLVAAAIQQVKNTLNADLAGSTKKSLKAKVEKLVSEFNKLGVQVAHIESRLGKPIAQILPDEFIELGNIYNSIKDGGYKPSDYFNTGHAVTTEKTLKITDMLIEGEKNNEAVKDDS